MSTERGSVGGLDPQDLAELRAAVSALRVQIERRRGVPADEDLSSSDERSSLLESVTSSLTEGMREVDLVQLFDELRRRLAFVTHTTQLYGRLTARENMALFAELRDAAGASSRAGDPLLERLGLSDAADRQVSTYSRGMMQRLALARALAGQPELLLLDEPYTALDRPGRRLLTEVLREERARGLAVLLSSHDTDAIVSVTDRVALLEGGRIVDEAHRDPADADLEPYRRRVMGLGLFADPAPARPEAV